MVGALRPAAQPPSVLPPLPGAGARASGRALDVRTSSPERKAHASGRAPERRARCPERERPDSGVKLVESKGLPKATFLGRVSLALRSESCFICWKLGAPAAPESRGSRLAHVDALTDFRRGA